MGFNDTLQNLTSALGRLTEKIGKSDAWMHGGPKPSAGPSALEKFNEQYGAMGKMTHPQEYADAQKASAQGTQQSGGPGFLQGFANLIKSGAGKSEGGISRMLGHLENPQGLISKGGSLVESGSVGKGKSLQGIGNLIKGVGAGEGGAASLLKGIGGLAGGAEAGAAGAAAGGGAMGGAAAGVAAFAGPVAAVAALGAVAIEGTNKLKDWNDSLHDANMKFAEFSGAMANVQAKQEVRDINLSQTRGDRRAESADYLAESKSELDKRMAVVGDKVANISDYLAGTLTKYLVSIIDVLTFGLLKDSDKKDEDQISSSEWMAQNGLDSFLKTYKGQGTDNNAFNLKDLDKGTGDIGGAMLHRMRQSK